MLLKLLPQRPCDRKIPEASMLVVLAFFFFLISNPKIFHINCSILRILSSLAFRMGGKQNEV